MNPNEQLRELMEKHQLTYAQVAEILGVSVATVTSWRRPVENKAHRKMPANLIELLLLKLGKKR